MKQKLIIFTLCTLALANCTNNQKTKQNNQNESQIVVTTELENSDPQQQETVNDSIIKFRDDTIAVLESVRNLDSSELELDKPLAYRIAKKLKLVSTPNDGRCKNDYHYHFFIEDDYITSGYTITCLPLNSGGYLVLAGYEYDTGYDYYGGHKYVTAIKNYHSYIYNNNEIAEIDFKLPICPLSELLDSSKCQGLEDDIKIMDSIYAKAPNAIMSYNIDASEKELEILYALYFDLDLRYRKPDLLKIGKTKNLPKYKWNGEEFVKQ